VTAFVWATVTGVSPLRVKLDGDTTALAFTPDSLVDPATLVVSSRVRCELSERRLVIHGKAGGDFDLAVQQALGASVAALQTRPQGVVPSSVAVGSGSATVAADGTVTFIGCSSVSLNDVFDGIGMDTYDIILRATTSTGSTIATQLRANGSNMTTNVYDRISVFTNSSANAVVGRSAAVVNNFGLFVPTNSGNGSEGAGTIRLFAPGLARAKLATTFLSARLSDGVVWTLSESARINTGVTDGLTFIANNGTMTGGAKVVKIS
jgi:hypothetical protein